jgi:predicted nucleotidyltransferase
VVKRERMERGEEEVIGAIVSTITTYLQPKRILLFGSRARGKGKRYSDFDVALEGVAMTHRRERELKDALDVRLGIFSVDLINLDKVDPEFKALIKEGGRVIYEQH